MFNTPSDTEKPNSTSPSGTPAEQPENWEARFKGLQTKFNELQTSLKGKEDYATQLQKEYNDLKAARASEATSVQGQLTQLQADLQKAQEAIANEQKRAAQLEQEKAALAQSKETRNRLLAAGAGDLLTWYEKGRMNVDGLEGEALTNAIADFRADLEAFATGKVNTTLSGAAAPGISSPKPVNVKDKAALEAWLNNPVNVNHADFQTMYDQYLTLLG